MKATPKPRAPGIWMRQAERLAARDCRPLEAQALNRQLQALQSLQAGLRQLRVPTAASEPRTPKAAPRWKKPPTKGWCRLCRCATPHRTREAQKWHMWQADRRHGGLRAVETGATARALAQSIIVMRRQGRERRAALFTACFPREARLLGPEGISRMLDAFAEHPWSGEHHFRHEFLVWASRHYTGRRLTYRQALAYVLAQRRPSAP